MPWVGVRRRHTYMGEGEGIVHRDIEFGEMSLLQVGNKWHGRDRVRLKEWNESECKLRLRQG